MAGTSTGKPRLLVISGVMPFPLDAGQHARVRNKLLALRKVFDITFLGLAHPSRVAETKQKLCELVDVAIVLPRVSQRSILAKVWHKGVGMTNTLQSGLRYSNYILGKVELSPERVRLHCNPEDFDLVLYEYWHTHATTSVFRQHGIPCTLDMHDLLWRTYALVLQLHPNPLMRIARRRRVAAYRVHEEKAWNDYDLLIAINFAEADYVKEVLPHKPVLIAPMGVDTSRWSYRWSPETPPRICFYGSLSTLGNQESARWCFESILPRVWEIRPDVEYWIVGARPPQEFYEWEKDPRVHVTGFVPDVAETLASMTLILCPWRGKFGFRSRLIEVMALGVPVVATPDAAHGMGLDNEEGIFLTDSDQQLTQYCLDLIDKRGWCQGQSRLARQQVERKYSFEATYGQLAEDLYQFALQHARRRALGWGC